MVPVREMVTFSSNLMSIVSEMERSREMICGMGLYNENLRPEMQMYNNSSEITLSAINAPKLSNYIKEIAQEQGASQGTFLSF
jgi:hypothetical protein